jgi:hypothetical protein
MAYLNTQKPPDEVKKDKADCQATVDSLGLKNAGLKRKKFDQCMKDKGYNVVSEEKALKIQGFKEVWIKPAADFKTYEAAFIDKVDLSQIDIDMHIPKARISEKDLHNLGEEMLTRFSKTLNTVMPVIVNPKDAQGKKIIYVGLKLNKVAQTNLGLNTALEVAGQFTPSFVPLPDAPLGKFAFEVTIADYSNKEKLVIVLDECEEDKNASWAGIENFERWKHAYNIMDYWADHLAALLAKERGQKYKSRLGIKLIDY